LSGEMHPAQNPPFAATTGCSAASCGSVYLCGPTRSRKALESY
jgi:hypothetical protein